MIKFRVLYIDIIFPVSLGPLTYRCPPELADRARPGMLVSAPLRERITEGIIFRKNTSPPEGPIKEIAEIRGDAPVLGRGLMRLVKWMSDYYLASEGIVLKQTVPKEIFRRKKARNPRRSVQSHDVFEGIDITREDIDPVTDSMSRGAYGAFLLHSPSAAYEFSILPALIRAGARNVIVLLPEVLPANNLYASLGEDLRERACLLHGEVPAGRRSECIEGILSGRYDIVIGTRPALFAPMKDISLILILQEHSDSYKIEEGVRYQIRDVAVMRGFMEKSTVLLASVTPSLDSYFNALSKKYFLISPERKGSRPRIRTIDMRFAKKMRPELSVAAFEVLRNKLRAGRKVMIYDNRRGYSTLLCRECGHPVKCPDCIVPMVFHKRQGIMRCHYCGGERAVPERCPRCGGYDLDLVGAGTERVQEDVEKVFGVPAIRFDSDDMKKKADIEEVQRSVDSGSAPIIVGTKMMTRRIIPAERFSAALVLNIDTPMHFPDFRAAEKVYAELSSIIGLVAAGGEVLIQTRFPGNNLFRYLKDDDYCSFAAEELSKRRDLSYPPYSRLLSLRFSGDASLAEKVAAALRGRERKIDVLGPAAVKGRSGAEDVSVLLKSKDRKALRDAVREIMEAYGNTKGAKITVDVDPA